MENQELLKYIEDAQDQGYSKDEIRDTLLNVGWRMGDIKDALYVVNEFGNAKFSEAGFKKQKFLIFIGIAIAIFLFGSSAFGGYYYYQTIPVRAIKKAQENLDHIESVKYKVIGSFNSKSEAGETNTGIDTGMNINADISWSIQGAFDRIDKEDIKGYFDADVSMDIETNIRDEIETLAEDANLVVSYKTVDDVVYLRTNIPSILLTYFLLDIEIVNDQWVEFNKQSLLEFVEDSDSIDIEILSQQDNELWEDIKAYNLLDAEYVKSEEINGVETRRLSFSVNKDELARFQSDQLAKECVDECMADDDIPDMNEVIQSIAGECWIGKKDGFVYRLTVNVDLKSEEDEMEGIMTLKAEFSDFNKPINVTAPVKTVKYEELGNILSF
ncbi:hypothetical protein D4R87_00265 [bacterium]|nr:MAG: hypothetical protein D4R87_00265 [bacterium]